MSFGNIVGSASFQLLTGKRGFTLGLQDAQNEAQGAVGKIASTLSGLGRAASQAGLALSGGLTAPLVGLTGAIFEIGSSFESAFAGVAKTFPGTNAQLQEFRQTIRDMANEMPATREEIAGVAEVAGQLGISATGLENFTRTMTQLGETTNLAASDAATALARFANIMGTSEGQFDELGNVIVDLGNNFATTESEIAAMSLRIAGAGQVVGLTETEVLSLATAMSSLGIRVEAGGSAISRVFITIANAVAQGSGDIELFADVAGQSVSEFSRLFEEDAAGALVSFIGGLQRMDQAGQNVFTTLDDLELGEIRVRDALLRLAGGQDILTQAFARGETALANNNALTVEYGKRVETIDSQLQILKNQLTDVAVSFFDAFRPEIVRVIERIRETIQNVTRSITGFLGSLDSESRQFILIFAAIAASIGPVVLVIGGLSIALSVLANPLALIAVAIATLAGAFVLLKTNSEFALEHIPNIKIAADNLEDSFIGLTTAINDLLVSLGLIPESADDATSSLITLGEVADHTFGILLSYPTLIIDEIRLTVSALKLIIDALKLVGAAFEDFFDGLTLSFEEFFRLISDPQRLITGDFDIGATFDFSETSKAFEELEKQGEILYKTGQELAQNLSDGFTDNAPQVADEMEESFAGFTLEEFRKEFENTTNGAIKDFALMRAHVLSDIRHIDNAGIQFLIGSLRGAQNEAELTRRLWTALGAGIINTNDLMITSFQELDPNWKLLEENSFDTGIAVEAAASSIDFFSQAITNAGSAISLTRDRISEIQAATQLWSGDLSNTEKAIEITQARIDKYGDPDGSLAKRLEDLAWFNARLTDRVEESEDAWASSIAIQGEVERQLEDLDRQFQQNLISPEQYAQLTAELNQELADAQDPMASFTGDIQKIADSMAEGIQAFKDLLIELGLLRDETGDPVEANLTTNAKDTAEDIRGVRDEVFEVPERRETAFNSIFANADEVVGYQDTVGSVPTEINTLFSASTQEGLRKIQEISASAIGFTEEDYTGNVYADAEEALERIGFTKARANEFATTEYEATLDIDVTGVEDKITPLLERVGVWASSTYQATMTIDTSSVYPAVDAAAQYTAERTIAHSPTEKGPLSVIPDWRFLFEGIPEEAERFTDETIQHLQNFVNLAGSILDVFSKSLDFSIQSQGFSGRLPSLGFVQELAAFVTSITAEVGFLAQQFEGGFLDATNAFNTAAQSSLGTLIQSVEAINALTELGGFRIGQLQLDQITDLKFLVEHLVESIGDTAGLLIGERGLPFIQIADEFAQAAQSSLALIVPAVDALKAIAELGTRTISQSDFDAVSAIKFFIEHLVGSIGDSAAFILGERGLTSGGSFFADAEEIANAGASALTLIAGINDTLTALSEARGITSDDFDVVSNIKFFVEHIVASFGDSARSLEQSRGEGFVDAASAFAEAVSASVSAITETLEFIVNLSETLEKITVSSEQTHAYASALAGISLDLAEIFDEVAKRFEETIEGSIGRLAEATSNSTSALSDTLGFLVNLSENIEKITVSSEQTHAYAAALAGIALDLAELFDEVAKRFEETIEGSISRLATAVSEATGALSSTLDFLVNLSENVEKVTLSSEDVSFYARILADRAVDIAEEFNRATEEWDGKVHPESEKLAESISTSLGAIGSALGFLTSLTDALAREDKVDFGANIRAIASQLAQRGREAAEAFEAVIRTWEIEADVQTKISEAGQVIQDSFGALNAVLSFMEKVTSDDFQIRGGQLRTAARRIAELGVNVGNIFASVGGSLSQDSRDGLDAYAQWFRNIEGIFDFLADVASKAPDAVQNAYTFQDAAREIALAIQTGTDALLSIGQLSELSFSGGFSNPTTNIPSGDGGQFAPTGVGVPAKELTVNLDIDGGTFRAFIIDTVNETIEEQF